MKKIFFFLLLALAGGALIFYYFIRDKNEFNIWQLVPSQSSVVIESKFPAKTWQKLLDSKLGEGFKNTEIYKNTNTFMLTIDSLSGVPGASEKLLAESMIISAIPTAQTQFELLYILPVRSPEMQEIFQRSKRSVEGSTQVKEVSRSYQEMTINEIVSGEKVVFAYTLHENHLVVSRSSFLIESVIRQINNNYISNFKSANAKLFDLPSLSSDEGNIYINYHELGRLLKTFVSQKSRSFFDPITQMKGGMALDLTLDKNNTMLSGFSVAYDSVGLLPRFIDQTPESPVVYNSSPGNTKYVWTYAFSNIEKILEGEESASWAGNDMSYMELPTFRDSESSTVLFIDTKDPGEALNYLNVEAEKAAKEDTVYREYYAGYPLAEITGQRFPELIFPELYEPFEQSFFTMINNYVVISNSLEALKLVIEDLENENTWGKNLEMRKFLNLGLQEANISLVVNPENFWQELLKKLNSHWKSRFEANANFLKGFTLNNLQLSRIEDSYYTSVVLPYEPREILSKGDRQLSQRFSYSFREEITSRPYVTRSHVSNQFEILVQDAGNNLTLLDWEGNEVWTDSIAGTIDTDIIQIDYYKNDKLQYFFTGGNKLFILDRNGDYVEDYPIEIGGNPIEFANVIDYDNSKNYRFILADALGSLYMVDKHGKLLDGWTPKALQGELVSRPFHIRVRARDYIIAVQKRGIVHVMNRRGEYYKGFPIDLRDRIVGEIYVEKGTDANGTALSVVTEGGELIRLNLNSKILHKEHLYRPTRETRFYLVPEAANNGYIIMREGLNRIAVLDESGNVKFEKDYLSVDPLNIQYYNFGVEKTLFIITDNEQQFSYLYNESGDLINAQPLNSARQVALMYFSTVKKYQLLKVYNKTLTAHTF